MNPQQTEGLTAERERALSALEVLHSMARHGSDGALAKSHNAEMDAYMRQIADLISRPSPPAQEAAAWQVRAQFSTGLWTDWMDAAGAGVSESDFEAAKKGKLLINGRTVETRPLYALPQDQSSLIKVLTKQMQLACDLLAERTYGSPARSPGHNARLALEGALALAKEAK